MSESVVLCEGYHDRAFWAGWLAYLGCSDPGQRPDRSNRVAVPDPWKTRVAGGEFAFHSSSGKFVRIRPCHGKNNILKAARSRLQDRVDKELTRLVISVDSDTSVDGTSAASPDLPSWGLDALKKEFPDSEVNQDGDMVFDGEATVISFTRWEASDADTAGLPRKQTLERLVCAALVSAYPARGAAVKTWLDTRPDGPQAGPKEFGWSYMAGWYAEQGCEAFYRRLWKDDSLSKELKSRLTQCGAWRIAEALAE